MRLTRRGWGVVGVVAFSLLMAAQYGSRSLNAVVAPLIVVLLAAFITVYRAEKPLIDRHPIEDGFIGETRRVGLRTEVAGPTAAVVRDAVGDGLTPVDGGNVAETTLLDGETYEYEVRLEARGEHAVGPLSVAVGDLLGLAETRFEYGRTTSVLVYPRIYDLHGGARHDLRLLADAVRDADREEFDHLREYARGDSLRDVHWKSAAKRADGELVVKEFIADGAVGNAEVAAECTPGKADEMAAAVASVGTYLLELDIAVGVSVPDGARAPDTGRRHHRDLLALLAVAGAGELDDRTRKGADVLIQADATGVVVCVDDHEIPFERLYGSSERRAAGGDGPGGGAESTASGDRGTEVRA
ncbi:DUF58 domain-containing protein [Natrononativus amylolyticus]|uniref:DUF58 domain-containing protein n=1 Tax=Natrononativus amylolyticus TaxID=2963434 RepID=UPI0020CE3818|nr:DUF58 domain-containing protein [Natrononativus amylolyticus]